MFFGEKSGTGRGRRAFSCGGKSDPLEVIGHITDPRVDEDFSSSSQGT